MGLQVQHCASLVLHQGMSAASYTLLVKQPCRAAGFRMPGEAAACLHAAYSTSECQQKTHLQVI